MSLYKKDFKIYENSKLYFIYHLLHFQLPTVSQRKHKSLLDAISLCIHLATDLAKVISPVVLMSQTPGSSHNCY